ncbi:MAG TPA: FAD binding domain-containing protein [Synergistaceae bacterium]|nr:FAD binding domain-containing protein [Synergistaceae bacterium]
MEWFFPKTVDEVVEHLGKEDTVLHGGGTMLLRSKLRSSGRMVDLSGVEPLKQVIMEGGTTSLGGGVTYAEAAHRLGESDPEHILVKSLGGAASTPLRNRITLGGSIMAQPFWSDLLGPLMALGAEIRLEGAHSQVCEMGEFLRSSELRSGSLVHSLRFPSHSWRTWYHREVRTAFDYAAFTLTMLYRQERGMVKDLRVVLTGTSKKVERLLSVEERLQGRDAEERDFGNLEALLPETFVDRPHGSASYLRSVAAVALERGLRTLMGGDAA